MRAAFAAASLGLAASALAQEPIARTCGDDGSCWGINIPEVTASSGNGDIYIQMTAPTSMAWSALGQGTSMSGAQIFVMYASGDGNVTVSPRLGTGHVMPRYNSAAEITMLEGTGISNGSMVANFRCSSCTTWTGGSASFSSDSGSWIRASLAGNALNSQDPSASISFHGESYGIFTWNYAGGRGGNSVNPFATTAVTTPETTGNTGDAGMSMSSGGMNTALLMAHGILASLAFVVFFPIGSMILRLANFSGVIWLHAAFQAFTYALYTAGFGIGVWIATSGGYLTNYHPIIGIIVFGLLFFQPILGLLHHSLFKKTASRTAVSHAHIWLGRIVITLGIINGGLGLNLAQNFGTGAPIAYGVVAGVIWLAWVASSVFGEMRRGKTAKREGSEQGGLYEAERRETQGSGESERKVGH